jgi:rare lipoprotein A
MSDMRLFLVVLMGVMLIYDGYCLSQRATDLPLRFVQSGIASWYGREEEGRLTSDGERFNRHRFTAASRKFPLDSIVRVTNENNGRSVQVRINDRGPFRKGRILDLSEAAADTLGMKKSGTTPVKIEEMEPPSAEAATAP